MARKPIRRRWRRTLVSVFGAFPSWTVLAAEISFVALTTCCGSIAVGKNTMRSSKRCAIVLVFGIHLTQTTDDPVGWQWLVAHRISQETVGHDMVSELSAWLTEIPSAQVATALVGDTARRTAVRAARYGRSNAGAARLRAATAAQPPVHG